MKQFKVEDLRTGMRVVYECGIVGLVMKDIGVIAMARPPVIGEWGQFGYNCIKEIQCESNSDYDIIKVYEGFTTWGILNLESLGKLLWSRDSEKDFTELRKLEEAQEFLEDKIKDLKTKLGVLE
jgi:hypothetical protein